MESKFQNLRFSEFTKVASVVAGGVAALQATPVSAVPATGTNSGAFTIHAGNASWFLNNNMTFTTTSSNWGFSEGSLSGGAHSDAFDGAIGFMVSTGAPGPADGYISPGGTIDISPAYPTNPNTDTTATGNVQVLAGLNVHGVIRFFHTKAIARSILIMQNPTGAPITVNVRSNSNWGSDNETTYDMTSSGDALADPSDNWYITRQELPVGTYDPSDPPLTYVFNGPGAAIHGVPNPIPVTGDGTTNMFWNSITIPPGQTRSIMVFIQMNTSLAAAEADAAMYATPSSLASAGLLAGLTPTFLNGVVNFGFLSVPTMSDYALMALGSLLGFFGLRRLSKALPRRSTAAS